MYVCGFEQKLLSPKGALYMVLVQENKPKDIIKILSKYGLHSEVKRVVSRLLSFGVLLFSPFYASLLHGLNTMYALCVAGGYQQAGTKRRTHDIAHYACVDILSILFIVVVIYQKYIVCKIYQPAPPYNSDAEWK